MNFNERTNTRFYKNISPFILERVTFLVCERWDGDRLLYWPKVLLTIAALLSPLSRGCSTVGHWEPKALCLPLALTSASCPQLTRTPPQVPGYIIVSRPPASAVLPLIYTGASLDWRLGRGSIYNNHSILIFQNSTCGHFLHVCFHPPHPHILQIMLKDNNSKNTKRNYFNNSKIQTS